MVDQRLDRDHADAGLDAGGDERVAQAVGARDVADLAARLAGLLVSGGDAEN